MAKSDFDPDQLFNSEKDIYGRYGQRGPAGAAFDAFDEAIDTLRHNTISNSEDVNTAINELGKMGVHIDGLPEHPYVGDVPAPPSFDDAGTFGGIDE